MKKDEYIFETGWEVCNKVGGIYTVLSTLAASLVAEYGENLFYIGPDFNMDCNPYFTEKASLHADWKCKAEEEGIYVKTGYWKNVPGNPQVILVDYKRMMDDKGSFLYKLWAQYNIDSMGTNADYEANVMFGYAAARAVDSFCKYYKAKAEKTVAQFHEWQTASGLLYLKMNNLPYKTVFTTHATTVGRSICFNNKLLYQYFQNYYGDQMAMELGVKAQHGLEKHGALKADCFTTVSRLTSRECAQLLDKPADVVTLNGFEAGFVPKGAGYDKARSEARAQLTRVAETLMGYKLEKNALMVGISGRLEYRNKGIDVFSEAMKALNQDVNLKRQIVAFIMVPDWIDGARKDLQEKLQNPKQKYQFADVRTTHELHQPQYDAVLQGLNYFQLQNNDKDKVKVVFIPSLLDGNDGIFNKSYYELLIGLDMTVFPSYYEPWGYTPMESAAFGIPTITTDLAGFGLWVSDKAEHISNGVAVIHRDDSNRHEVVDSIRQEIETFADYSDKEVEACRKKVKQIADKGSWSHFVEYYKQAFAFAKGEKYVPGEKNAKVSTAKTTAEKAEKKTAVKRSTKTAAKKTEKK